MLCKVRNAFNILLRKLPHLEDLSINTKTTIKLILEIQEVKAGGLNSGLCERGNKTSGCIEVGNYLIS
jgi:hypothetical protein